MKNVITADIREMYNNNVRFENVNELITYLQERDPEIKVSEHEAKEFFEALEAYWIKKEND